MHGYDDEVDPLFVKQYWHPLLCLIERLMKLQAFVILGIVPVGNAGRRQAQHADSYAGNFLDDVRAVMCLERSFVVSVR